MAGVVVMTESERLQRKARRDEWRHEALDWAFLALMTTVSVGAVGILFALLFR